MNFIVLTIFPDLIDAFWSHGIVRRAIEADLISAVSMDIRAFSTGKHKEVDDRPYGGGNGMVMRPEPLAAAIRAAKEQLPEARTVLLTPRGRQFTQQTAETLAGGAESLILICGRYEGVDERVCQDLIDIEVSIGDFILTGGEIAAMMVIEAVIRFIPGALGGEDSATKDSFQDDRIEHAHYTRPAVFEDNEVPTTLLSGNHAEIEKWRQEDSLKRTFLNRPDLLNKNTISPQEKAVLENLYRDLETIITG